MKGWKTLLFNLFLVIMPPALAYLASVNWSDYLSPTWTPVAVGLIGIALRAVTTTPIGSAVNPKINNMAVFAALTFAGALALFGMPAHAADLRLKAQPSPFLPAAAGGWYVGLGTSAGVAQSSVGGNNLFAPSLVGGSRCCHQRRAGHHQGIHGSPQRRVSTHR